MRETAVLVAGGGPTGLTLGALLAKQGIEAVVVEEDASTTTHPQAHAITGRTMEVFRSLGIDREIYARGLDLRKAGGIRYVTSLAGDELAHLSLEVGPKDIARMLALSPSLMASTPQDLVEPLILGALTRNGGEIQFGTKLTSFVQDEKGVIATLSTDGGEDRIRAQWMVACDGAASPIRKALDIPTHGREPLGQVLGMYFHADLSRWSRERPAMLYWLIDEKHPAIFIALDGAQRWVLHVPWDPEQETLSDYPEERCLEIIRHCIGANVPIDLRSVLPWVVTSQIADRFREGRVLVAGDAAHRFPPAGGSGLNTGVQDAHNLAWKLAEQVRGHAGAALLDTYEQERLPIAEVIGDISVANAIGKGEQLMHPPAPFNVIGPERGQQGARLASGEVTLAELSDEIAASMTSEMTPDKMIKTSDFLYAFREGAIVTEAPEPGTRQGEMPTGRPGERAPHFGWVDDDAPLWVKLVCRTLTWVPWIRVWASTALTRSSHDLFGTHFVLLTVAAQAERWRKAATAVATGVDVIGVGSDIVDLNGDFRKLCGIDDGAVLVRPDGYVMWSSARSVPDPDRTLKEVFERVLRAA